MGPRLHILHSWFLNTYRMRRGQQILGGRKRNLAGIVEVRGGDTGVCTVQGTGTREYVPTDILEERLASNREKSSIMKSAGVPVLELVVDGNFCSTENVLKLNSCVG